MAIDFEQLGGRIRSLLNSYVAVRSDTNSELELNVDAFFDRWFETVPYFRENPGLRGHFPIPGDYLGRKVHWCLRRGAGADTVVLIHHCDCVETSDYGMLEDVCLDPDALEKAYLERGVELPADLEADVKSGEWVFGRGASDMKGGGAIELALVEQYCAEADFTGNVLVLAVPDEENLSAGMRGACHLMKALKEEHGLNYVLMIDTEPHERGEDGVAQFYDGAIGKLLPVVYVKGKLAHVGQVYQGFSPIPLLAEIVRRTDLNPWFIEHEGNTTSPAPAWLYSKDQKLVYDVSLPGAACGFMSILPLAKSPMEIMGKMKELSQAAFEAVIKDMNTSYARYLELEGQPPQALPWQPRVRFFGEIYAEALEAGGAAFEKAYAEAYSGVKAKIQSKEMPLTGAVISLIETTLKHVKDQSPTVVLAVSPPYYPSVTNSMLGAAAKKADDAIKALAAYAETELGQPYTVANYFTGICDLSYAMFKAEPENVAYVENNMLLWGEVYDIPLDIIRELSMPVVNIGPWGKALHKFAERVYKKDLFDHSPRLVDRMVRSMLAP
ncbi:M20/M25/M40 family metallo-hydrolase [Ruminococcaceae bacterium OttesenSCG-928-A11]|nr:M20/M25/M40 family metallo-hydrolase [Ruminococcaceae bacterium OttesenSCG-928-A11]